MALDNNVWYILGTSHWITYIEKIRMYGEKKTKIVILRSLISNNTTRMQT